MKSKICRSFLASNSRNKFRQAETHLRRAPMQQTASAFPEGKPYRRAIPAVDWLAHYKAPRATPRRCASCAHRNVPRPDLLVATSRVGVPGEAPRGLGQPIRHARVMPMSCPETKSCEQKVHSSIFSEELPPAHSQLLQVEEQRSQDAQLFKE